MRIAWTHWLLLGRLIKGEPRYAQISELHDLEAEGYVFKEGKAWVPTSAGIRAHAEKLATTPSWESGPDPYRLYGR